MNKLIFGVAATVIWAFTGTAYGQSAAFTYQGQLKDGGVPFTDTADFQFTLWDAAGNGNPPVGGVQLGGVQAVNALPVTAGLFTTTLNAAGVFGVNAFNGNARWLQIAVRSPAGAGAFTTLAPRQPLTATPYALFALSTPGSVGGSGTVNSIPFWSAGTTLGNSLISQDNGVVRLPNLVGLAAGGTGGQVSFGAPNGETGMLISGTNRADIRFNGSTLRLAAGPAGSPPFGGIGIETTGIVRLPNIVTMEPGGTGGQVSFAGPNGETGMTIAGASGRADLRFDGTTLKLFAGAAGTPPANGIAIDTAGKVGIGTTDPVAKLHVVGGPLWTSNSWNGSLSLSNASAIGWGANPSGQHFGIGQSTGGLYFFRTHSPPGTTASPANYDVRITDKGNLIQAHEKGGLVKAMISVDSSGIINRCYNGMTDASTGNCGFSIVHPSVGHYSLDFGFEVWDRFVAVTPVRESPNRILADFYFEYLQSHRIVVQTIITEGLDALRDNSFMIIVY